MKIALTTDLHRGFDHNTYKMHDKMFLKLAEEDFDVLVISGDLISSQQKQMESMFKCLRRHFPDIVILVVYGNHDYWDKDSWLTDKVRYQGKPRQTFSLMEKEHQRLCGEYDIYYLQDYSWRYKKGTEEVLFLGYDGWYNNTNPDTNDKNFIPRFHESAPFQTFLNYRAHKALDGILKEAAEEKEINKDLKLVCVTHFNTYIEDPQYQFMMGCPSHLDFITELFDLLLVGHTHHSYDKEHGKCRVVNAGTYWTKNNHGYNCPKYVILEV